MKTSCFRLLKILILITCSLIFANESQSQKRDSNFVNPGDDTPPDEPPVTSFPFSCNVANTNSCNLILNNSFAINSSCQLSSPSTINTPFINCVDYWTSSHGTPQINKFPPQLSSASNHASMWTHAYYAPGTTNLISKGEGIAVGIPKLIVNRNYTLSFFKKIYTDQGLGAPDIDDFWVVLLKCSDFNNIRVFGEIYDIPSIPSTAQILYHESNATNLEWQNVSLNFIANDQYDVLWIFPKNITAAPTGTLWAWLEIAFPELKDNTNCIPPPCTNPIVTPNGPIEYYTIIDNSPNGVILTSNKITGNQWYYNGNPILNATAPTITVGRNQPSSGVYYVVNGGCQSNAVTINFKMSGYGTFGEQIFNLGSKSYPVLTPGFFCPNTISNPIRQFDMGSNATYKWNVFTLPGGTPNVTIKAGSSSPNSYQAQVNVGSPTSVNPVIGNSIQAVADLNGNQKIIDFQYLIYPESRNLSVCANNIVHFPLDDYTYYWKKPGGSNFDWEDYDFGLNSTIIFPTDPSLFVTPHKLHIPGGNELTDYIRVKFSGTAIVTRDFYDNNGFGGCYKHATNISILSGCKSSMNSETNISIYPNPATTIVNFTSSTSIIKEIEIFGIFNNTILKINGMNRKQISTNISNLNPGVFNCRITTSDGVINKKLFVKR